MKHTDKQHIKDILDQLSTYAMVINHYFFAFTEAELKTKILKLESTVKELKKELKID